MCWDLRFMLRFAITFGISFWTKRQYCCFPIHSMPMKSRDIRFPALQKLQQLILVVSGQPSFCDKLSLRWSLPTKSQS
ncbi:hypothetical protein T4C_2892 [Trichinella pseudospiralis]|uniref:Secreted protein n=1 Tax=Trichinella pseudospiralis TaxID=6337 RepID=A0A0V1JZX3_TRIPS|nr:hypothetical protein T4C_2892 [Trichinella pseudospiralis]